MDTDFHASLQYYVLQVMTGEELRAATCLSGEVQAIVPREIAVLRKHGKWQELERTLLPGYVFVGVREMNAQVWHEIINSVRMAACGYARLLGSPTAITAEEAKRCLGVLAPTDAPLHPSVVEFDAYGTPRIVSGPLAQMPERVIKFDRRQHRAHVAMEVLGEKRIIHMAITPVIKEESLHGVAEMET